MSWVLPPVLLWIAYFADFKSTVNKRGCGPGAINNTSGGTFRDEGNSDTTNDSTSSISRELSPLLSNEDINIHGDDRLLLEDGGGGDGGDGGGGGGRDGTTIPCPPKGFSRITWYVRQLCPPPRPPHHPLSLYS